MAPVGLCKFLTVGGKPCAYSISFFTLPFKSLFVFLIDFNYLRVTEITVYLMVTTINILSKHKNSPSLSIMTDN